MKIRLSIYGNTRMYDPALRDSSLRYATYYIYGTLTAKPETSSINFRAEESILSLTNRSTFFNLSQEIAECEFANVLPILSSKGLNIQEDAFDQLHDATIQQIAMIKTLFIFFWRFELALLEYSIPIENEIYDDFILDGLIKLAQ